jgi:hypothetical protein
MSWRDYIPSYSPFAAPRSTPTVTENDYHYLGPDDIVDPPRATNSSYPFPATTRHASRADAADPRAPDILILKYKSGIYPLHFPAFSIGEGELKVSELRKAAAEKIGNDKFRIDPRRIKLLYKGKPLNDDSVPCNKEGLKQNSELMCVVLTGGADESSESADESEIANGGVRIDLGPKKTRKGHRAGKKKSRRPGDQDDASTPSASSTQGRNSPVSGVGQEPLHRPPHPSAPAPIVAPSQSGPKSAMDKLEDLSLKFHSEFLPHCKQFVNHPPSDAKARDFEYKKLSESILAQIILKLDEVETDGNEEARSRRKALVKETQAMLNQLDGIGKPR